MKKAAFLVIPLALGLFSQTQRDNARDAYREWKQADPALEHDAAEGGAAFAARANRAAEKAAKYGEARIAFLHQLTSGYDQTFSWLEDAQIIDLAAAALKSPEDYLATESAVVNRNIAAFQNDSDKAMQQLQHALERERKALVELSGSVEERKKAVAADREVSLAAESARLKAIVQVKAVLASLDQTTEQTGRENAGWADYYRKLAGGAPQAVVAPAIPTTPYAGAWTYPASNGTYHGLTPESVDLVVREENGRAIGTLTARFSVPPGSTDDAELRVNFSGEFQNAKNQVFNLDSAGGVKGTIELIPGSAPNLLEVNVEAGLRKILHENFVLVKK